MNRDDVRGYSKFKEEKVHLQTWFPSPPPTVTHTLCQKEEKTQPSNDLFFSLSAGQRGGGGGGGVLYTTFLPRGPRGGVLYTNIFLPRGGPPCGMYYIRSVPNSTHTHVHALTNLHTISRPKFFFLKKNHPFRQTRKSNKVPIRAALVAFFFFASRAKEKEKGRFFCIHFSPKHNKNLKKSGVLVRFRQGVYERLSPPVSLPLEKKVKREREKMCMCGVWEMLREVYTWVFPRSCFRGEKRGDGGKKRKEEEGRGMLE